MAGQEPKTKADSSAKLPVNTETKPVTKPPAKSDAERAPAKPATSNEVPKK